jgi:hypothetical protein
MLKSGLMNFGKSLTRYVAVLCQAQRRIAAAVCLTAVIAAIMLLWIHVDNRQSRTDFPARINYPLPSLVVKHPQGKVDLNSIISGSRCIIVFYAPSCKACKEILPALQPLPGRLRLIPVSVSPEQDFSLLGSSWDVDRFYDQWGVLSRSFAAASLPVILFVDEKGILRHGIFGSREPGTLRQKLKDFASHSQIDPSNTG